MAEELNGILAEADELADRWALACAKAGSRLADPFAAAFPGAVRAVSRECAERAAAAAPAFASQLEAWARASGLRTMLAGAKRLLAEGALRSPHEVAEGTHWFDKLFRTIGELLPPGPPEHDTLHKLLRWADRLRRNLHRATATPPGDCQVRVTLIQMRFTSDHILDDAGKKMRFHLGLAANGTHQEWDLSLRANDTRGFNDLPFTTNWVTHPGQCGKEIAIHYSADVELSLEGLGTSAKPHGHAAEVSPPHPCPGLVEYDTLQVRVEPETPPLTGTPWYHFDFDFQVALRCASPKTFY